ncbi:MAG: hypothetical protein L3K15_04005 [Thermoplasmata archaeon]|nr:hypothetical protein [Thermoplasmata archaeon]
MPDSDEAPQRDRASPARVVISRRELDAFWRQEIRPTALGLVAGGASLVWVGFWAIALGSYSFAAPLTHAVLIGEAVSLLVLGPAMLLLAARLWTMRAEELVLSSDGLIVRFRRNKEFFVAWSDPALRIVLIDRRLRRPTQPPSVPGILRLRFRWYGISTEAIDVALHHARTNELAVRSRSRTGGRGTLQIHRLDPTDPDAVSPRP